MPEGQGAVRRDRDAALTRTLSDQFAELMSPTKAEQLTGRPPQSRQRHGDLASPLAISGTMDFDTFLEHLSPSATSDTSHQQLLSLNAQDDALPTLASLQQLIGSVSDADSPLDAGVSWEMMLRSGQRGEAVPGPLQSLQPLSMQWPSSGAPGGSQATQSYIPGWDSYLDSMQTLQDVASNGGKPLAPLQMGVLGVSTACLLPAGPLTQQLLQCAYSQAEGAGEQVVDEPSNSDDNGHGGKYRMSAARSDSHSSGSNWFSTKAAALADAGLAPNTRQQQGSPSSWACSQSCEDRWLTVAAAVEALKTRIVAGVAFDGTHCASARLTGFLDLAAQRDAECATLQAADHFSVLYARLVLRPLAWLWPLLATWPVPPPHGSPFALRADLPPGSCAFEQLVGIAGQSGLPVRARIVLSTGCGLHVIATACCFSTDAEAIAPTVDSKQNLMSPVTPLQTP
jgi:hypothetical protein